MEAPRHFATGTWRPAGRKPRDPESVWVAVGDGDLDQILRHEETRTVGQDNTVVIGAVALQIAKQPGRPTAPTGVTLAKAVRSLVKHKRSIHLSTTVLDGVLDSLR